MGSLGIALDGGRYLRVDSPSGGLSRDIRLRTLRAGQSRARLDFCAFRRKGPVIRKTVMIEGLSGFRDSPAELKLKVYRSSYALWDIDVQNPDGSRNSFRVRTGTGLWPIFVSAAVLSAVLVCLFMVLMNRSCSSRPEGGSVTPEISLSEENGSESRVEPEESGDDTAFSRAAESSGIPYEAAAEKPGASGAVVIPEKVILLFRPESYVLTETGREKLESLATLIPDNSILEIGGHCADFGTERGRMALSLNRAETVAAYLSGRIPGSVQVNIRAYGSSVPVNTRPDDQDENRRVEIVTEGGTE